MHDLVKYILLPLVHKLILKDNVKSAYIIKNWYSIEFKLYDLWV